MVDRVATNTLQHTFNRLMSHVVGAYQQGRHWAGMLDNAVQVGRRAYGSSDLCWTKAPRVNVSAASRTTR